MFTNPEIKSMRNIFITDECMQKKQVTLKPLTLNDIDEFMVWATDDEVTKYMMWSSYTSCRDAENFFVNIVETHPWFKAICIDEKIIGSMTLDKGKGAFSCKAELGYVIARKYWGNGLATRAVAEVLKSGFEDLDIERIEAYVDPTNIASYTVLEKNGFLREGLLRNCLMQKGVIKDRFLYSFLRNNS